MLRMAVTYLFMIIAEGVTYQVIFHRSMIMVCLVIYQLLKQGLMLLAYTITILVIMQ